MRWLDGIINSMDVSLSTLWEMVEDRGAWRFSPRGRKESLCFLIYSEEVAYKRGEPRADDKRWGSEELTLGGI